MFKLPPCIDFEHLGMFRHVFAHRYLNCFYSYKGLNPFLGAVFIELFIQVVTNSNLFGFVSQDRLVEELGLATRLFSHVNEMLFMEWKLQSLCCLLFKHAKKL